MKSERNLVEFDERGGDKVLAACPVLSLPLQPQFRIFSSISEKTSLIRRPSLEPSATPHYTALNSLIRVGQNVATLILNSAYLKKDFLYTAWGRFCLYLCFS